ncbi:Syntaxin-132 [Platanthera guangdongensis]|uniref:Syntaxin-132 n=1 Tax=Platanthera guangdongensis TaxID=2320717 RepID=A0ABR2MBU7_9ASPA
MVSGTNHQLSEEKGMDNFSNASTRGRSPLGTPALSGGQSASTSWSVGSPSSRSELAATDTPASDRTFVRRHKHLDVNGDEAGLPHGSDSPLTSNLYLVLEGLHSSQGGAWTHPCGAALAPGRLDLSYGTSDHERSATGNRPDEETIDQLIETGNGEQIFQIAIQEQGLVSQVTTTLAEIQERGDAIFYDMSVFVGAQGDILDNIDSQVSGAADDIQSGTAALLDAKKPQKNSRKWIIMAIIFLFVVVIVILVAVLRPWSSGS